MRIGAPGLWLCGCLTALPLPALAQDAAPLSAIDWLSDSITAPPVEPAPTPSSEPPIADSATVPEISVTPLDNASPDPVGILDSTLTGLPRNLWSGSAEATLVTLVRAESMTSLPAIQDFLTVLLLAEADPPLGAGSEGALFLARVDKLLDLGRLEQAQSLLEAAEADTPALFRRWFDVALLTGTENDACTVMLDRPAIAPTLTARIFCLARSGDWPAAALTLNTSRVLGDLSEEEEALLSRFLDPELYEGEDPLPKPARVSPLNFRMFEAIGEALPTASKPLAFAHADLREIAGWKAQLEAAERLSRAGALPATILQDLYTSRTPSASGGVWDRVEAFQRFDTAISARDPNAVARHLPGAWAAMRANRAEVAFAALYGADLADLPLTGDAADIAFRAGLLSESYETIAREGDGDPFLTALAQGTPQDVRVADPVRLAVQEAFNGAPAPERLSTLAENGKLGEALLRALAIFNAGAAGDPASLTDALAFFRSVGLEDLARRSALQLIILDRPT